MSAVESVFALADAGPTETVVCELHSTQIQLAAGATTRFDMGIYAGPLSPKVLGIKTKIFSLGSHEAAVAITTSTHVRSHTKANRSTESHLHRCATWRKHAARAL